MTERVPATRRCQSIRAGAAALASGPDFVCPRCKRVNAANWSGNAARVADRARGAKGRCQSMGAAFRIRLCFVATFAFAVGGMCTPVRAVADPVVTVFPGMEMRQGDTTCTVGYVEARLRIALTGGQCRGGSTVTDSNRHVLGTVVQAHRNAPEGVEADGSAQDAEYEVVALEPSVAATEVLPTGRQLQSSPALRAVLALPVCRLATTSGEICGHVSAVGNGRFVIADMPADKGEFGGPVYALTDDNHAVIVGLFAGTGGSMPEAESWEAVMRQVYLDGHVPNRQPLFA
jgi:hypothetical protein